MQATANSVTTYIWSSGEQLVRLILLIGATFRPLGVVIVLVVVIVANFIVIVIVLVIVIIIILVSQHFLVFNLQINTTIYEHETNIAQNFEYCNNCAYYNASILSQTTQCNVLKFSQLMSTLAILYGDLTLNSIGLPSCSIHRSRHSSQDILALGNLYWQPLHSIPILHTRSTERPNRTVKSALGLAR